MLFFSCTYDKVDITEETPPLELNLCDSIYESYQLTIVPIINSNCTTSGCHDAGSPSGNFTTYNGLKAKVDNGALRKRVLEDKDMPPSGSLSQEERDKLNCWLEKAAPNN